MALVALSNGGFAQVDDADLPLLDGRKWYAARNKNALYAKTARNVAMHRVILGVSAGHVDHINGDGLDNRRSNLRITTVGENLRNRQKKSGGTSQYIGVYRFGDKWKAEITDHYKRIRLGKFDTELAAFSAYQAARLRLGRPLVCSE